MIIITAQTIKNYHELAADLSSSVVMTHLNHYSRRYNLVVINGCDLVGVVTGEVVT